MQMAWKFDHVNTHERIWLELKGAVSSFVESAGSTCAKSMQLPAVFVSPMWWPLLMCCGFKLISCEPIVPPDSLP